ncbi:hypothetical protein C8Q79DRAFT_158303 [Trametes meyenii]|nr:hypothetical protein C8Q79DRAFT_158303 [Trametes meyenii]
MENCRVPIEVCERIIDLVAIAHFWPWDIGSRTLLACTLVCSAWQQHSCYRCYKDLRIRGYSQCMSLLDTLRKHTERRGWVQTLHIDIGDEYIPFSLLLAPQFLGNYLQKLHLDSSPFHPLRALYPPHFMNRVLMPLLPSCRNITCLYMGGKNPLITYWHIFRAMPQLKTLCLFTYDSDYNRFQPQQIELVGQMWPKVCLQNLESLNLGDPVWSSQEGLPLSRLFRTSVTNLALVVNHLPLSVFELIELIAQSLFGRSNNG